MTAPTFVEEAMRLAEEVSLADLWEISGWETRAALRDHLEAREALLERLAEALERVGQTLAWQCFGDCRAYSDGPIPSPAEADQIARTTLAAYRKETT